MQYLLSATHRSATDDIEDRDWTYDVKLRHLFHPLLQWESFKYYKFLECAFVALGTEREMRMCHIVICGLSGCTIVFHFV